jgi:hypothetical protein
MRSGCRLAERTGFLGQLLVLEGAFDQHHEALGIDRLVLKMIGAALGGLDGGVERGVAGEHDHFGVRPLFLDRRQEIQPVSIGQLEVEEQHIRLRTGESRLHFRGVGGFEDFIILGREQRVQQITHVRIVIHHHDFCLPTYCLRWCPQAPVKARNKSWNSRCFSNKRSG